MRIPPLTERGRSARLGERAREERRSVVRRETLSHEQVPFELVVKREGEGPVEPLARWLEEGPRDEAARGKGGLSRLLVAMSFVQDVLDNVEGHVRDGNRCGW